MIDKIPEKTSKDKKINEMVEKINKLEEALLVNSKGTAYILKLIGEEVVPNKGEDKQYDFFK